MIALAALARLAAGAAASWLVHLLTLPVTDEPLAGTLAILPLVVAALAEIGIQGRRLGARATGPAVVWGEAIAAALLVVLALARPRLALPLRAELLLAGLVLVLALHVARRLLALRPLLGRRLPRRPSWVFLALPFVVYLALLPWSTRERPPDGDEPWYLLITHSLAYDADADLTNNYARGDWRRFIDRPLEPQPGDPKGPDGELYSRHNALLPLALALPYRLAGKLGALVVMALLTAALAWMTLRLGYHYAPGRPGEVLAAYALVAFTPPLLLYAYQIWVEVPAALLSMIALDALLELRRRRLVGQAAKPALWLLIAITLALLPLLKIRFMLLALPLAVLAWWYAGRPLRPALLLALAMVLVGGGILLHNQLLYGNPLKIHTWQEVELHHYPPVRFVAGSVGLFYDSAFGLFACAPLWLLLVPAALLALRRREPLLVDLAVFALPYLAIVAPRAEWYGGWSPPFRYALVALPLLGLGLVPLLADRRRSGARALLGGLAALTLVLTLLWVAVPGWTYNFADGRTYLLDHLGRRLGADVARLFPSYVRIRAASWLWPLASLVLVPLVWWAPRRLRLGRPALAGVAVVLAAVASVPVAAHRLPTRVIELEDAQVARRGGHLHPERWVIERPRYRGGWVLRQGEELTAPVVGGGPVRLAIDAFYVRHRPGPRRLELEVLAGGEVVATVVLSTPREWTRHPLPELDWPVGAPLTLRLPPARHRGQPSGVVLDRVELDWR